MRPHPGDGSALYTALERLSRLPARWLAVGSVALTGLIGIADWATGPDAAFSIVYLIPVFLAATGGRRLGLSTATVATVAWSTVEIASRTRPYSSPIVPYWNTVSRYAVLCLVAVLVSTLAARLAQERGISRTDLITGLPNARAFHEVAGGEIERMRRTGTPLTVAYLDIDDFKRVNDTYGHSVGDELLRLAARTMGGSLRATDLVARLGGDEFAVLLPGADLSDALARLGALHGTLVEAIGARYPGVGFSVGAVTFADPPYSAEHLLADADRVMYGVKQSGKNRVRAEAAGSAGVPANPVS